ncbi:hypothetical protein J3Q64DRAFT_1701754 [Phycomyces blakesleeanus]|uniref:Uncharacterized protein n=1 Tax=Phycomyces blakesleeanus TaxID=4837 RepID=A0ABR3ARS7_PHYBL
MCLNMSLKIIQCAALLQAQMAGERMAYKLNFAYVFAIFQLFFAHYKSFNQVFVIVSANTAPNSCHFSMLAMNISTCIYTNSLPASLSLHTIICFFIYYVSELQCNLGSFSSQVNSG